MSQILEHAETRLFQRQLIDESIAVARDAGKSTRENLGDEIMTKLGGMPFAFRSSMSEDLERGKPLELRWLSGRVHRLGLQFDVLTPGHSAVYRALVLHKSGKVG